MKGKPLVSEIVENLPLSKKKRSGDLFLYRLRNAKKLSFMCLKSDFLKVWLQKSIFAI